MKSPEGNYFDWSEKDRKRSLTQQLIDRTEGLVKISDLITVVDFEWEGVRLIDQPVGIRVHTQPHAFANAVTLRRLELVHSWAGRNTTCQYGKWVVGEGQFGKKKSISYSDNGELSSPEETQTTPNFDISEEQIAIVLTVIHDSIGRREPEHEEVWAIHVYCPALTS